MPAHVPVLLQEVVEALNPQPGQTYLDCTAGHGGHAAAIARRLGPTGTVVLCDLDPGNLDSAAAAVRALPSPPRVIAWRCNFAEAPRRMTEAALAAHMVLADLGFASSQIDQAERGLSFSKDGPLDMRLDPSGPQTAAQLVNTLSEGELADLIYELGEEPASRRIAQKLIQERKIEPITSTTRLAEIVRAAINPSGKRHGASIDPATRTFQALRIAVNDELANLQALLDAVHRAAGASRGHESGSWLVPGAVVAVISFHSLEDRPVKQALSRLVSLGLASEPRRGPITAGEAELAANPRSRSAKLRVVRLAAQGESTAETGESTAT